MQQFIDLHVHTTASDGTMSPAQVVRYAAQKGLSAIAITDHDTIEGVEEAVRESKNYTIEVIPGIEISVDFDTELHILGYYINQKSQSLTNTLEQLKVFRSERNPKIIDKLNALGFNISMKEVKGKVKGSVMGRPHIAAVMLEKGYVKSVHEAFELYLSKNKPAYVERKRLSPIEGIELIQQAGGIAVLAHPSYLEQNGVNLESLLKQFIPYGLKGIEAYYSEYPQEAHEKYLLLAQKYHLIVTGGSDFHGHNKPDIELGEGYGNLKIPYRLLRQFKNIKRDTWS